MVKSLNLKAAIGGAACLALAAQAAAAQNTANSQLADSGLKETFSAADVSAIMADYSIQTTLVPYRGDALAVLAATTPGGATFRIALFLCDDPATGATCKAASMFTGLSNAGVSYDDINTFHTEANVTKAINISEQNIMIFSTQLFFGGGIGRDNFKLITELFLTDVQRYLDGKTATANTISLNAAPPDGGKADNMVQARDDEARPVASMIGFDVDHALSAAIANTWDVRFALEEN